jgi:hypothetical protein
MALSIHGRYKVLILRTNGQWSVDIIRRLKFVQVIFWHTSFTQKHGEHVLMIVFGLQTDIFKTTSNEKVVNMKVGCIVKTNNFAFLVITIRGNMQAPNQTQRIRHGRHRCQVRK